jgi:hypothetical protein
LGVPKRLPLPSGVKEPDKEIKVKLLDVATGFLTSVSGGADVAE